MEQPPGPAPLVPLEHARHAIRRPRKRIPPRHGDALSVRGQSAHPVLKGVKPFTSRKLYKNKALAPTATALQIGDNGKGKDVVTLVNEYKGGRMFYTSLGVPEDFKDENFRRMLVNALHWTARREPVETR